MKDYLVFDGISSADYGTMIFPKEIDNAPKRDVDVIKVPGRNGSLIIDNGRYEDVKQSYTGVIIDNAKFDEYMFLLKSVILGDSGYKRLEDTFKPDEYRMAYFDGNLSPNVIRLWHKMGKFELSFVCKPQRFLKLGESTIELWESASLFNPTIFPAQPLIRVQGYGTLTVGDYEITIEQGVGITQIDIDCERMDAYSGNVNCNNLITLSSDFPVLKSGITEITFDSTISTVKIQPKWWQL